MLPPVVIIILLTARETLQKKPNRHNTLKQFLRNKVSDCGENIKQLGTI
jgi:hypothetical protein